MITAHLMTDQSVINVFADLPAFLSHEAVFDPHLAIVPFGRLRPPCAESGDYGSGESQSGDSHAGDGHAI